MQLYLFRVLVGIFYVDIYQQMSTKKCQNQQKKCQNQQKNAKNYYCEICDVTSNKLSEYKRHLDTKKHKSTEKRRNQQEKRQNQQEKPKKPPNIFCAIKLHSKLSVYMKMDNL
jgi:hypothetical protein